MASIRELPTGKFELTLRHKALLGTRRIYATFDTRQLAEDYSLLAEQHLKAGHLPEDLLQPKAERMVYLDSILRDWINTGKPAPTDMAVLVLLRSEVGKTGYAEMSYAWCEAWVQAMKLKQNLAPGTIRKRIGSLSRCIDWHLRTHPEQLARNPLKLLPRGSALYTQQDAVQAKALDLEVKVDVERNRRLAPGEDARIRAALAGEKRPGRERAFAAGGAPDLAMLYALIVDTGLRLREAYTLTRGQVDLVGRTLRVQSSKQHHGRVKFRDVPLKRELHTQLADYLEGAARAPQDPIFPFWDGTPAGLTPTKSRLSATFSALFGFAGCADIIQHDLRHEATCRWFELRRPDTGQWVFRDVEIFKMMGWAPGSRMGARYASFRADDLAARLW